MREGGRGCQWRPMVSSRPGSEKLKYEFRPHDLGDICRERGREGERGGERERERERGREGERGGEREREGERGGERGREGERGGERREREREGENRDIYTYIFMVYA